MKYTREEVNEEVESAVALTILAFFVAVGIFFAGYVCGRYY